MKLRFNNYDIVCSLFELQKLIGMRVNQIYDIDNKTFLIRFQGGDDGKVVLLIKSGVRFHTTAFEWPKNFAPSGFTMKLRKHLKNKRLEKLVQLGSDRIVDFEFGTGEAAYHVILELYDRGNIIFTDHSLTILNILRPHHEGENIRFAVREKYPTNRAKNQSEKINEVDVKALLETTENNEQLKYVLMKILDCGPSVIEHVLKKRNMHKCMLNTTQNNDNNVDEIDNEALKKKKKNKKVTFDTDFRTFDMEKDFSNLLDAIEESEKMMFNAKNYPSKGYIIQKEEIKPQTNADGSNEKFYQNIEYHPFLLAQYDGQPYVEYDSFNLSVDEFYSKLEEQKIDLKTLQQERDALKKLANVKEDHAKRLQELSKTQEIDKIRGELISMNQELVDKAIYFIRSAVASQMAWDHINELLKQAQISGNPIAKSIHQLKLEINHISLKLSDPYQTEEENKQPPVIVDIDLSLSAWANASEYYEQKRSAAQKEKKTIDSSQKALKSTERKTQQALKDVRSVSKIIKARKVYWFEKFYWFISSENYLVIGGRDAQQNELIVKRYMRASDIYVHAEIQGASSVVIRNPIGNEVPPKTLVEAGTMAISYSVAWDAKVATNAYWVYSHQVSKTAPSGEYLGTGSFMIRGKKNFLPECHLIMGMSLLFKLEESFIDKHRGDRRVRLINDDNIEDINKTDKEAVNVSEEEENVAKYRHLNNDNEDDSENMTTTTTNDLVYPDTEVKIEHDTGRVTINTNSNNQMDNKKSEFVSVPVSNTENNVEEETLIPAVPGKKKQQSTNQKRNKQDKNSKSKSKVKVQNTNQLEDNFKPSQMKRGQKSRLNKIKEKYADQDEEERKLRVQLLKGSSKETSNDIIATIENDREKLVDNEFKNKCKISEDNCNSTKQSIQQIDDEEDDLAAVADCDMLDSLTGQPFETDELLFVIPVVAPYQSLQNYKFKVKITPGSGRRGRSAKTALSLFSNDKSCIVQEKTLLKSIKEEALARNIPGKVKISAPHLQKLKK